MESWFPALKEVKAGDEPCVICIYHAGGNGNVFYRFMHISEKILVAPVELPGHGRRAKEPCGESFVKMAKSIAKEVSQRFSNRKLYIYGHSLGTILAYEVCKCLEKSYDIFPKLLIVSGRNAPFDRDLSTFKTSMGEQMLIEEMRRYQFMPETLLENKGFMDYFLPITMNDYKMGEDYLYDDSEKILTPIFLNYGDCDIEIVPERLDLWKDVTKGSFHKKVYSGGHFFMFDKESTYFEDLVKTVIQSA